MTVLVYPSFSFYIAVSQFFQKLHLLWQREGSTPIYGIKQLL